MRAKDGTHAHPGNCAVAVADSGTVQAQADGVRVRVSPDRDVPLAPREQFCPVPVRKDV